MAFGPGLTMEGVAGEVVVEVPTGIDCAAAISQAQDGWPTTAQNLFPRQSVSLLIRLMGLFCAHANAEIASLR